MEELLKNCLLRYLQEGSNAKDKEELLKITDRYLAEIGYLVKKDLPKWKKVKDGYHYGIAIEEHDTGQKTLCVGDYEIDIQSLVLNLPKKN